jgi:hypothetical protein
VNANAGNIPAPHRVGDGLANRRDLHCCAVNQRYRWRKENSKTPVAFRRTPVRSQDLIANRRRRPILNVRHVVFDVEPQCLEFPGAVYSYIFFVIL